MKYAYEQYLVLALALFATLGTARGEDRLTVTADTPTATIETNSAIRNFLRLPDLEFSIRVELECANGSTPVSLLVSVADTRKSVGANGLASGEDVQFDLQVPADQIAPIAIDSFCRADSQRPGEQKLVPAALSAQASLRCAGESAEQTIYASTPLDVELECAPGATEEEKE